jgi:two-component system, OmpR family, phosphate regulon response regulator PhoB
MCCPHDGSAVPLPQSLSVSHILIVEDDKDIADLIAHYLQKAGHTVAEARSGTAALAAIKASPPVLVLLDLMLPGIDGLELTRMLKRDTATSRLPIVMLTARGEEVDRIVGLELGADDYISKPFSPREVVLRVKAVLRRLQHEESASERLEIGSIQLDVSGHQLRVRGKETPLTATEFRLLRLLMERAGRVQTRGQLLSDVWGYAEDIDSRTVDTHIRRLRRKLGPEADRIETVIGVGYRLRP